MKKFLKTCLIIIMIIIAILIYNQFSHAIKGRVYGDIDLEYFQKLLGDSDYSSMKYEDLLYYDKTHEGLVAVLKTSDDMIVCNYYSRVKWFFEAYTQSGRIYIEYEDLGEDPTYYMYFPYNFTNKYVACIAVFKNPNIDAVWLVDESISVHKVETELNEEQTELGIWLASVPVGTDVIVEACD